MGTTTSRIGSDRPPGQANRINRPRSRARARLSSLLACGCSSSHVGNHEVEHSVDVRRSSSKGTGPVEENTSLRSRATERLSSNTEAGTSSESSNSISISQHVSVPRDLVGAEISKEEIYLKTSEELGLPNEMGVEDDHGYGTDRSGTVAGTSFREPQSSDLVNAVVNKESNSGAENPVNEPPPCICPSRSLLAQEANEMSVSENSSLDLERFNLVEDTSVSLEVRPLVSGREQNGMSESLSHVGPMSASSNNDSSYLEHSSNSRISPPDAISRSSFERLVENPNRDFSSGSRDYASSQTRRVADSNGGFPTGGVGVNNRNERRQHSRSEIWDIVFGSINENQRQTNSCPFGVHSGGPCSCDSFLTGEESSIHLSISRIVMLAEALFEVLDEMQPRTASFSLPLASVAAPESVVDSFPVREHKKPATAEPTDDDQQCHICLSEYEDGDKIRLLPCHHEYHMACVDKWLKEIHGVCPLCRGDVARVVSGE